MEIEDHFGDLQEFYYKSKDGDLVINRSKSDFGILEKNWKRMYVKQKEARTDFVNWIYKDGFLEGNEVYRTDLKPADIEKMTYHDLVIIIRESDLKPILQN